MNKNLFTHNLKVIHCSHHKAGSFWIACVLRDICNKYGKIMSVFENGENRISKYLHADVLYDNNSQIILDYNDYTGSHMIRDPRDIIISGYFYHQWTKEKAYNIYMDQIGMTYKEKLKSLSLDGGIMFELVNKGGETIELIKKWDKSEKFLEVKYEDFITDCDNTFLKLFTHWGINSDYLNDCLDISRAHHMTKKTGRKIGEIDFNSHMRSGKPGQWKEYFNDDHKQYFKNHFEDLLIKTGYEKNNDW